MKEASNRRIEWLVLAMLATACGQAGTSAQTGSPSQPASGRPRPAQGAGTTSGGSITLEFDLPAEFLTQPAGSAGAVTGFRVGYFRANESEAIRTVDVVRDAITVQGRTARMTLPRETVSDCGSECAIRVQTLTRGGASAWSASVPLDPRGVDRQAQAVPPRQARPRATPPERVPGAAPVRTPQRAGLTPGDLKPYVSLSESLRKLLPSDASLDEELQRFRRIQDLALAVVISRDHDIPFTTLSRTLAGPPRLTPRNALVTLRKDLDVRDVLRKTRPEVRRLVEVREGAGNTKP